MDYHLSLYVPNVYRENETYVHFSDKKIMGLHLKRAKDKMNTNINNIVANISKLKTNNNKKYQISGYHEFKILDNILKNNNNIKYSLLQDDKLFKNAVTHIFAGFDSECCSECDLKPQYEHKKVPMLYVHVYKL